MTLMILLKISLAIFMAGNWLEMGLRLNPEEAFKGLRRLRFVMYTLLRGFVPGLALAYAITLIIPLELPYSLRLMFMGMSPSAPFLSMDVDKVKGDLSYISSFMLMVSIATVIFMPLAAPILTKGITVSAWMIAKPLLLIVLLPMAIGMVILRWNKNHAKKMSPVGKRITGVFTWSMGILCFFAYGKGFIGAASSFGAAFKAIFFPVMAAAAYQLSLGLLQVQRIVLSLSMTARNTRVALVSLFSIASVDERAIVMGCWDFR